MRLLRHIARAAAGLLTLAAGVALTSPAPRDAHAPTQPVEVVVSSGEVAVKREPAPARVVQSRLVTFEGVGEVEARAVEQFGEPLRVEFVRPHTSEPVASVPFGIDGSVLSYYPREGGEGMNPFLRFEVVRVGGARGGPLVFAVAVTPGGSDCGFEALIIGARGGRIEALHDEPLFTNIQGGMYVGDLGRGRGAGAAVWTFLWENDCHYCEHRYEVRLLPFDAEAQLFRGGPVFRSRKKYGGRGEGALAELGLSYGDLLGGMPDVAEWRR